MHAGLLFQWLLLPLRLCCERLWAGQGLLFLLKAAWSLPIGLTAGNRCSDMPTCTRIHAPARVTSPHCHSGGWSSGSQMCLRL